MTTSTVDRSKGIPGSDAAQRVAAMGGPVAQRASRRTGRGPEPLTLTTRIPSRPQPQAADSAGTGDETLKADSDEHINASADVDELYDPDEWVPLRTTLAERRRRMAEEQGRTAGERPLAVPGRATSGSIPARRRTDALPRQRRRLPGWTLLWLGALVLIALYLVIGWLYTLGVGISNRLSYGPTPTSYLEAVVGDHDAPGHPTSIVAMNVHGTVVIQVAPGGDFSKSSNYILTTLDPRVWGNLDDVVVTLEVQGHGPTPNILVHLQGDPDLSHFYQRPTVGLVLLNQRPGFKASPSVDR